MHHAPGRLAPASPDPIPSARARVELEAEIRSENLAISHIEEAIDQSPVFLKTCAYCSALAVAECVACEESLCEDDGLWRGSDIFCPE